MQSETESLSDCIQADPAKKPALVNAEDVTLLMVYEERDHHSMMKWGRLLLTAAVLLSLGLFSLWPATLHASGAMVSVLQDTGKEIVLEFSAPGYTLAPAPEIPYQSILIEGCGTIGTAGAPAVAIKGELIEIPEGCTVEVSARSLEKRALRNVLLSPAPRKTVEEDEHGAQTIREEYRADAALYGTDAFFPGKLAEAGFAGYLRDKHVVNVMFYPVQYNPVSRQLELHKKIRVTLKINPAAAMDGKTAVMEQPAVTASPAAEEKSFSGIYASCLLNYKPGQETPPAERQNRSLISVAAQSLEREQSPFAIKARVTDEGIYKITYEDLNALGIDLSATTNENLKVENQGVELAVYRSGSGPFKAGDYILFYGVPFKSLYTKQNIYWVYQGSGPGKRMASIDGNPANSYPVLQTFHNSLHAEEDHVYAETIPNGEGVDHWFWTRLQPLSAGSPASANYTLTLQNFSTTSGNFSMKINLRGYTTLAHHTKVYVNGTLVADFTWSGQIELPQNIGGTSGISPARFQEGANTIKVEEWLPSGQTGDRIYVNWFEVNYVDTYVAESDVLKFKGEGTGGTGFQVTNFSTADIWAFDVTDPVNVSRIQNPIITASGSSNLLNFEDTLSSVKTYYALTVGNFKAPAEFIVDEPSSLKTSRSAVDYIIITHEAFYNDIQRLKDYRAGQGLGVEVVKIQDIYDEFSYGLKDAWAIKDFLTYAFNNWHINGKNKHPTYVLLVGDASMDYRDDYGNAAQGYIDYVPTYLFQTSALGDTPTDNWYVCVSGTDPMPDMIIGRLCVRPPDDTANIIDKIIAYESAVAGAWSKRVIFAADGYSEFEVTSNALISLLPGAFTPQKVYLSTYANVGEATTDLIGKINGGALVTFYTGHGSVDNWSGGYLFHTPDDNGNDPRNDLDWLNNANKLTFVLPLDCLNGFFCNFVDKYSLAEEMVRAKNKGAIASLASTGLGFNSEHQVLAEKIIDRLFTAGDTIAGSAVYTAKINAYRQIWSRDILETFTFFGDPATVLKTAAFFTTSSTSVTTSIALSTTTTSVAVTTSTVPVTTTTTVSGGSSSTTTTSVAVTTSTVPATTTTTVSGGSSSTTTTIVPTTTSTARTTTTVSGGSSSTTTTSVPTTTSTVPVTTTTTIPEAGVNDTYLAAININGSVARDVPQSSGTLPGTSPSEIMPLSVYAGSGRPIPLIIKDRFFPPLDKKLYEKSLETLKKGKVSAVPQISTYAIGNVKQFWVKDDNDVNWRQVTATSKKEGAHSIFYVDNNLNMADADLETYVAEFETMFTIISNNIGTFSDRDGNGKIIIFIYDINDSASVSTGWLAGYFWSKDYLADSVAQQNGYRSNEADMIYIRGNAPTGWTTTQYGNFADSTLTTLIHEYQHLVHFCITYWQPQLAGKTGNFDDTWINEMMSMSSETMYFKKKLTDNPSYTHDGMAPGGYLEDRVQYYNKDPKNSIRNGHGLVYWDNYGDVFSNYSLAYIFGQYLNLQSSSGQGIYKEILDYMTTNSVYDYRAVVGAAKQRLPGIGNWEDLIKSWAIANMLNQTSGLYGYQGAFSLTPHGPTSSNVSIHNGGIVYRRVDGSWTRPADAGANIKYCGFSVGQDTSTTTSIQPGTSSIASTTTVSGGGYSSSTTSTGTVTSSSSTAVVTTIVTTSLPKTTSTTTTAAATTTVPTTTTTAQTPCAAKTVLGNAGSEIALLQAFRDTVLSGTHAGRTLSAAYYRHTREVTGILMYHTDLKAKAQALIVRLLPVVENMAGQRRAVITSDIVQRGIDFIDSVAFFASPALREDLMRLKGDMQNGVLFNALKVTIKK